MFVRWFVHGLASLLLSGCVVHCGAEETEDGETDGSEEGGRNEGANGQGAGNPGGNGEGAGDEGGAPPQDDDRLFVVTINGGVASYRDPAELNTTTQPTTNLAAGADTLMYGPRDVAISKAGELFVACENGPSINVYANAAEASGALEPTRMLLGNSSEILAPIGLTIDDEADTLYVVNSTSNGSIEGAILAFEGLGGLDGDLPPSRTIVVDTQGFAPLQIVEHDNRLYVAGQGDNTSMVYVFDGASSLSGNATPDRIVSNEAWGQVLSIFIDDDDRLFAVDSSNQVFLYDDAATLSGNAAPSAVLEIPEASGLSAVTLDRNGVMFLADSSNNEIMTFPALGQPAGAVQLSAARSFDSNGLLLPTRIMPFYRKR